MQMEALTGQYVKVSPRSLTVKDEEGKILGVIRGVNTWETLPVANRLRYHEVARQRAHWEFSFLPELSDCVFLGDHPYYLYNTHGEDVLQKADPGAYERKRSKRDRAARFATVIDVAGLL